MPNWPLARTQGQQHRAEGLVLGKKHTVSLGGHDLGTLHATKLKFGMLVTQT